MTRRTIEWALEWLGTDETRARLVAAFRSGRPHWVAPLAPLDDAPPDDPASLEAWLRDIAPVDAPYPRHYPLRWANHYALLTVMRSGGPVVVFDPNGGGPQPSPHPYPPPPMDLIRRVRAVTAPDRT